MPLQRATARERFRLDPDRKVPGPAAGARMAGVFRAVVPNRYPGRGKRGLQPGLDAGKPGFAQGARTRDAIQTPWAITNANVSPRTP